MKPIRYLITGDPARTIQPQFDTSLLMMHELLKRGIEVDYCDLFKTDLKKAPADYLKALPVQNVIFADNDDPCFIGLAPSHKANCFEDYDVILHRKDPPVDDFYIRKCEIFSKLPAHILQLNNPDQIWRHKEHTLPMRYPSLGAPTTICSSFEEFLQAVRTCPTEAVCKPHNECSGIGIEFYRPDTDETTLKTFWDARKPQVIVQPFLKEIETSGDLRVLLFNGVILGSVLRVPKKGSRLANLHQGGSGVYFEITEHHRKAAKIVADDLRQFGIYMIGLDFIGDKITEVNITSPTALPLINKLMNIQGHIVLVDEMEKLRLQVRSSCD
jgi:glutathione synthase